MKTRLLAGALLLGAVFVPASAASANTGCRAIEGITDPDVAATACYTVVGLVPDSLCDKYHVCLA